MLAALVVLSTLSCMRAANAFPRIATNRPAGVPQGYVVTPFGYFHPSCVNQLAQGDRLHQDEKTIEHADGAVYKIPPCAFARYGANGEEVSAAEHPKISGWIANASVTTTASYGLLYAFWDVPPAPKTDDGQTLFFFNGLEDINDTETILQPVLGWNSDFASAWGIASWNCCVNGTANEATPQKASSGDLIFGYTHDSCASGTLACGSWLVETWDLTNGNISRLAKASSHAQTFNWAFGGVVEVYYIVQCGDYPEDPAGGFAGGAAIHFYNQKLFDDRFFQVANPAWKIATATGLSPSCGTSASTPQEISITY